MKKIPSKQPNNLITEFQDADRYAKEQTPPRKHYFQGNVYVQGSKCMYCGNEGRNPLHYMNALDVCDNPDGPCSCGAWHKPEDKRT